MSARSTSRVVSRAAAVVCGALVLAATVATPAVAATPAATAHPALTAEAVQQDLIVGDWLGYITREDGVSELFSFSFAADGTVALVGTIETGQGTWTSQGPDRFEFEARVETLTGYRIVTQDGTVSGPRFSSTGVSAGYTVDGTLIESLRAEIGSERNPWPYGA